MSAAKLDIMAYKRVPWTGTFIFIGPDYSDAAFLMQIRQHRGDISTPLLQATVSATFDPDYQYYDPRKRQNITAPATIVTAEITEAALEALPLAAEEEKPLELRHDLHITPTGLPKHVALWGDFTIDPGVTI